MQASHKVIFNTLVTYTRSFITVFITLYSTRLIINALGIDDFGLYSLVGGVVGMLAFFNSALTTSTQRYISISIGKGMLEEVKKVVANSVIIHLSIAIVLVLFIEVIGYYFIQYKLTIPQGRLDAAMVVFHFVVASTFVTIVSVPSESILNAHENMLFLAVLGVIDTVLRLGAALFLSSITSYDRLKAYAFLLFTIMLMINLIKWSYCIYKYKETKISIRRDFNKYQIKEQTSFVGWNLFGAACSMGRGHGIAIISNMFFGTVVNAAYGIANQIKSQSSFFSVTVLKVMNPQIMKSEGGNDRQRMLRLSLMACKFGFFLLAFFAIPLMFEMENIIQLWLGEIPKYVINFCILTLIGTLIEQVTVGLKSSVQAVGNIRVYMMIVGGIILLNIPLTYLFLHLGFKAEIALMIFVALELIAGIVRIKYTCKYTGLLLAEFIERVLLKILIPTLFSLVISYLITRYFSFDYRFILTILSSSCFFFLSMYFFGLCQDEKVIIQNLFNKLIKTKIK